jgi:ketosteroid isomerase-like protein
MRGSGVQLEQETALVLTLNDGRIRSIDHFLDHEQARRAAGAPPPAP